MSQMNAEQKGQWEARLAEGKAENLASSQGLWGPGRQLPYLPAPSLITP